MRILLLCASILGLATMVSAQETVNVNDGHIYKADAKTGVTCKNKWIIDRIHTSETFLNLQFIKDYATRAKTAVIDKNREKIYIGYSKRLTTIVDGEEVSNDYAHLVILDLKTGAYEKELPLTVDGVAISGLLCANQVGIDDFGHVWICGMYSDVNAKPAQIYVVEDFETGACKLVGEWKLPDEETDAAGRIDYWDVVGDITGAEANAVCMGAVGATASGEKLCLYRWELAQGATEWVANEDGFAGYVSNTDLAETYPADQVTWGQSSATVKIVAEEGFVGSMFYVDGFTTCPSLYDTSLRMVESFASAPDLAPQVGANGVEEFSLNGKYYLAYVEAQYNVSPGCRVNVCQLGEDDTFNGMRKLWSLPEGGLGEVSDGGNRVHSIDTYKVVDKNGKEGVYLLTYKCNNGLGLYCIAEDGFIDNYPDFEEKNEIDGVIYEVIDQKTVKVKSYSNRNSNIIEIPSQVDINGKAYLVTEIGSEAFIDCTGLTSVTIPNSITLIGASAFSGCSGLTEVYYNAENCSTMGSYSYPVFRNCSNLKKLNIGNNVKTIPNYAFKNCTGLTEITIPNSITAIGSDAFYGCTGLTEVYYNAENCSTMGSYSYPVFHGCSNLKKLNIGNNVKIIPNYAFYNCSGLTEITIPNSVTAIGDAAFYGCSNLKLVINLSNLTISKGASNNGYVAYYANNVINAPNGSIVEDFVFSKANNTNTLIAYLGNANELILPNDFNGENYTIGANAFYNCSNLTSVTIPNSITAIGSDAFSGCSNLTTLILEDGSEDISGLNFPNSPIETLHLGRKYSETFMKNKTSLIKMTVGNNVTKICEESFYGCTNLTDVEIPNSVTKIGKNAFWNCNKLITNEVIDKTQTTVSIALATPTKFQTGIANENEKIASESNNIFINGLKPNTNYTYNSGLIINDIFCDIKTFAFTTKDLIFYHSDIIGATSASLKAYYEGDVSVIDYGINWGNNTVEYNNLDSISVYNLDPNTTYYVYYFINTKEGGEYSTSWSIKTKLLTWNAGEFTATSTTSARLSVETNCDAIEGTGFEWKRYDAPNDLTPYKAPCPIVNGTLKGSLRGLNSSVYYKCRPYYTSSSGKTHYGAWFAIFTGDANVYFEPEVSTSDKNTVVDNSAIINGYALAGSDDILEQGFEYWKTSSSPTTYSSSGVMIAKASGISMSATISDLEYNSTYKYRAFAKTEKGTIYGKEVEFKTGNDPVSVENIEINNSSIEIIEIARYDIHGRRLSKPTPGFNIVIYSNGTTRKEIVKLPPTTIKSTNN